MSRVNRNLWVNLTVLELLALYWMHGSFIQDEEQKWPTIVKVVLFILGAFVVWPYLEYNAHRFDLHGEDNLPEDESHREV